MNFVCAMFVADNSSRFFDWYVQICEYCYEDYMEKGGYYDAAGDATFNKKIQCVYCWSRHTLTDM